MIIFRISQTSEKSEQEIHKHDRMSNDDGDARALGWISAMDPPPQLS